MPRLVNKTPAYRHRKSDGRAVVTIDGRDIYLGRYGSPESRAEYDRLIATWLANGRRTTPAAGVSPDLSVNELILRFWRYKPRRVPPPGRVSGGRVGQPGAWHYGP
ncbi:MAG: hypothetical protein U0835_25320 [Isosphaeraceae bacterium]